MSSQAVQIMIIYSICPSISLGCGQESLRLLRKDLPGDQKARLLLSLLAFASQFTSKYAKNPPASVRRPLDS